MPKEEHSGQDSRPLDVKGIKPAVYLLSSHPHHRMYPTPCPSSPWETRLKQSQDPCKFLKFSSEGLAIQVTMTLLVIKVVSFSSSQLILMQPSFHKHSQKLFLGNLIILNKQNILKCYLDQNEVLDIDRRCFHNTFKILNTHKVSQFKDLN